MRKGFTLIELMVASLLLAMVVTILTMVFNQSSIAWRTGVASVANLSDSRSALGTTHDVCDELLPGLGDTASSGGSSDSRTVKYRTVSLWDSSQENTLRSGAPNGKGRAFSLENSAISWGKAQSFTMSDAQKAQWQNVVGKGRFANDKVNFAVGVRSLGPDGQPDTSDDISTWPLEID